MCRNRLDVRNLTTTYHHGNCTGVPGVVNSYLIHPETEKTDQNRYGRKSHEGQETRLLAQYHLVKVILC